MSKYNAELDLETENSLSIIINMINPNSRVLEFGPAHGRLTKYLKEELKCNVTIVEIDEVAGKEAANFSEKSFVGIEKGDIEKYFWYTENNNQLYDYIVFADVLEHLYHPENVLKKCNRLLNEEGKILISIPNIAHNSIIIELLNDQFSYNEVGLLDNTHIRFFTYYSFKKLVEDLDYQIIDEFTTYSEVGENEISVKYEDVSIPIKKELKSRPRGKAYQYIFSIGKKNPLKVDNLRIENIVTPNDLVMKIYVRSSKNKDFCEEQSVTIPYHHSNTEIEIPLSKFKEITEIRIDPCECKCIFKIEAIYYYKNNEKCILEDIKSNAENKIEDIYFFNNTIDPQFVLDVLPEVGTIWIQFQVIDYEMQNNNLYRLLFKEIETFKNNYVKIEEEVKRYSNYNKYLEKELNIGKKCINTLEKEREDYKKYQEALEIRLKDHSTYQVDLENQLKNTLTNLEVNIREKEEAINRYKIYSTELENRINEHKTYGKELESRIDDYKTYSKELENRIDEHKTYNKELENRIDKYKTYSKELENRIDEHKTYNTGLEDRINHYINTENKFQEKIQELSNIIQMQNQEIKSKNEWIENIKNTKWFKIFNYRKK